MAKPGSEAARALSGARDLSRARMSDEEVLKRGELLEILNGLRCGGCGQRIGRGFTFVSIAPREEQPLMKLSACARPDCGYAAACRPNATYVEQVEYVWLDEPGMDAAAARAIVEQNERLEAKRAAAVGDGGA
jgi:hypothetical protein